MSDPFDFNGDGKRSWDEHAFHDFILEDDTKGRNRRRSAPRRHYSSGMEKFLEIVGGILGFILVLFILLLVSKG